MTPALRPLSRSILLAKVVVKGPLDREKCIEYFGSEVEACRDLK